MTGLYPFDPLAVDHSKLRIGDQYQLKKDNPDDNLHLLVDVAHEDFIPEDAVILQTAPISPQTGHSKAPDLVDGGCQPGGRSDPGNWPSHRPTRASRAFSVPVVTSCHWRLWSLSSLLTC